ncbi:MAG: penicillin acylase family protein [Saprospiraceae bacterium]|nr:penicillin acylase family protein [Saprospiraceae bacterium]
MIHLRRLLMPILFCIGYTLLLYYPINTSSGSLPPIGSFFNPFSGFWQNAEKTTPGGRINLSGMGIIDPVVIVFDERMVPHVYATDDLDLALLQGYLHAKDRLWQMDITARQASGRLAEIFGGRLLENDQRMRRMGLAKTAENLAKNWAACDDYKYLENYVAGVNYYINNLSKKEFPVEFKLFNYHPELWSIEKTAHVVMSMNLMLCGRNEDLAATNTRHLLGMKDFDDLFPKWNPKQSPIIPSEVDWSDSGNQKRKDQSVIGFRPERMINDAPRHIGSNNWAVQAGKTEDGFPILCNDPHLSLTLPSIWYEIQMKSEEYNAYGVSLPGIPHIAIGFNEYIAWGETNVGMDVSDLYEIEWVDSARNSYHLDGKVMNVSLEVEEFKVKNAAPVLDTIKQTIWGPVFFEEGRSLALQWLPNLVSDNCIIASFESLNRATNFLEYYESLRPFKSPAQNFIFASKEGDIALKVQGALPIKPAKEGRFILDGSKKGNEWSGYVPFESTPFVHNPVRGFVASANQHPTDTTYPYAYHGYFDDFRGRSLNERLHRMDKISIADMKALQNSTFDLSAAELLPLLLDLVVDTMDSSWLTDLKMWNHEFEGDAIAPVKFSLWENAFNDLIWDEISAGESTADAEMLYPELWRTIEMLEKTPDHPYFDLTGTSKVETAKDLALLSLDKSMHIYDSLTQDTPNLDWKTFRSVNINHLSRIPAFSIAGIDVGGTANALNSIKGTHGPSWRMIVQLSDPIKAWGIYPGGQSGNPGSPYYQNMISDWARGEYYELHFAASPDALKDFTSMTITIKS